MSIDNYEVRGPVFEHFDELKMIGIKTPLTPETHERIQATWNQFSEEISAIENTLVPYPFGICIAVHEDDHELEYMAALSVSNFSFIPKGMNTCVVPAGEYAVFTHVGSLQHFPQTMEHIFQKWLPNADVQHRGSPEVEVYDSRFDPLTRSGEVDYRVPISR